MSDLGYVFAAGDGVVGRQSVPLARSIQRNHPEASVYVFVPTEERPDMDDEVFDALADVGAILTGSMPVSGYPISTKIAALRAAQETATERYLAMLDTDMVLLDRIDAHESGAELYLKPVDVGRQFWGRDRSRGHWRDLYERYDGPMPDWTVESTFDGLEIPPYWNAGVVVTRVEEFGRRWVELTRRLHGDIPYDRHADQVALGILSSGYDVEVLDYHYNYPIHLRLRCPEDVVVLHYHQHHNLKKVTNRSIRAELSACGLDVEGSIYTDPGLLFTAVKRYVKRRIFPIDEEHFLERQYLRARAVFGREQ
jgi:hypothetical protein